uniref:Oxidoreductase n=1 Tax=Rhizophora mucronata TaxID=61149 RepID=A0A2P2KNI5_RHIMU
MNIYSLRHMKGQVKRHRYIWYKSPSSVLINGFYSATRITILSILFQYIHVLHIYCWSQDAPEIDQNSSGDPKGKKCGVFYYD